MKILIAGAGIGGLCAAHCLQKSGHEVVLLEQSNDSAATGSGLQLGANALKVLDYIGLMTPLERLSVAPERVDFCSYASGKVLHTADLGASYQSKYGAPYLHVHRADLHDQLRTTLHPSVKLTFNSRIQTYRESNDSVSVSLSSGGQIEGDCLIGADGVKSNVRANLLGVTTPRFSGNVAWRGVVPRDRLPQNFMDKVITNFVGPNKHMVIYYLRKQQLVNFVGVVENVNWTDQSWVSNAPWQALKDDFSGWHNTVQAVIDAVDKDQCFRWALYNHLPFKNWSTRRVTLLGDAAHSTLPFLASGAAMAIEDARILQRALEQKRSVADSLQLYQSNRFERTAKIQKLSSQMAKLYHITNPVLLKLAFKAVKLKSDKTEAFLAGYDSNTVTLT